MNTINRVVRGLGVGLLAVLGAACGAADSTGAVADEPVGQLQSAVSLPAYSQQAYLKASNTEANDGLYRVATSSDGNTAVMAAPAEDSNATGINGVQSNNAFPDSGAVYVMTRSGSVWTQQAYIKASNTTPADGFGSSIALSADGTTLAVGAPGEDSNATGINGNQNVDLAFDSGAVYVFTRSAGVWTQQAYIKASNTGAADAFGTSVALSSDGSYLAVGATLEDSSATGINGNQVDNGAAQAGAAYVYLRSAGVWSQQAYIKASNAQAGDNFGGQVSLAANGATLAVGATFEDSSATGINGSQASNAASDSGAAYVFGRSGATWSQQAYVKASNTGAGDIFATSLQLSSDGNTLAVGAPGEDSNATGLNGDQSNDTLSSSGAVYVVGRTSNVWSNRAYLKATNSGAGDSFGDTLGLSGDGTKLLVGAYQEDSPATGVGGNQLSEAAPDSGAAYGYALASGSWVFTNYIKASNTEPSDHFARAVSLSNTGSTAVLSAKREDSNATGVNGSQSNNTASDSGAAYVLTSTNVATYAQEAYVKASNAEWLDARDAAAIVISEDGNTLVLGIPWEDSEAEGINGDQGLNDFDTNWDAGAVYVFRRVSNVWSQEAYIKSSLNWLNYRFGYALSLSADGNTLAVGATGEASASTGVNGAEQPLTAASSGAVYVFTRTGSAWAQQAYVKASNTNTGDKFGYSVSLSSDGNTMAVGAINESSSALGINGNQADNSSASSGAAYVFSRAGALWSQQAYVKASNTGAGDVFGWSVTLSPDSNTLAVGAPGEDSAGAEADNSAVDSGASYVFTRSGTVWTQQRYLKPTLVGAGDNYGVSVSLSVTGDKLVVGAPNEDSNAFGVDGNAANDLASNTGAAYVHRRISGVWSEQHYLKASNPSGFFGISVKIAATGNDLVVGAPGEDNLGTGVNGVPNNASATDSGAAYAFSVAGSTWVQRAYVKASNTEAGDAFGYGVSLSQNGNMLAVVAKFEDSGSHGVNGDQLNNDMGTSGAGYVFLR